MNGREFLISGKPVQLVLSALRSVWVGNMNWASGHSQATPLTRKVQLGENKQTNKQNKRSQANAMQVTNKTVVALVVFSIES